VHPSGTGLSSARQRTSNNEGFASLPTVYALNIKPGSPHWEVGHKTDLIVEEL
jgi:hypothetical protein